MDSETIIDGSMVLLITVRGVMPALVSVAVEALGIVLGGIVLISLGLFQFSPKFLEQIRALHKDWQLLRDKLWETGGRTFF